MVSRIRPTSVAGRNMSRWFQNPRRRIHFPLIKPPAILRKFMRVRQSEFTESRESKLSATRRLLAGSRE